MNLRGVSWRFRGTDARGAAGGAEADAGAGLVFALGDVVGEALVDPRAGLAVVVDGDEGVLGAELVLEGHGVRRGLGAGDLLLGARDALADGVAAGGLVVELGLGALEAAAELVDGRREGGDVALRARGGALAAVAEVGRDAAEAVVVVVPLALRVADLVLEDAEAGLRLGVEAGVRRRAPPPPVAVGEARSREGLLRTPLGGARARLGDDDALLEHRQFAPRLGLGVVLGAVRARLGRVRARLGRIARRLERSDARAELAHGADAALQGLRAAWMWVPSSEAHKGDTPTCMTWR